MRDMFQILRLRNTYTLYKQKSLTFCFLRKPKKKRHKNEENKKKSIINFFVNSSRRIIKSILLCRNSIFVWMLHCVLSIIFIKKTFKQVRCFMGYMKFSCNFYDSFILLLVLLLLLLLLFSSSYLIYKTHGLNNFLQN